MKKVKGIPVVIAIMLIVLWSCGGCVAKAARIDKNVKTMDFPLYYIQNKWGLSPLNRPSELTT